MSASTPAIEPDASAAVRKTPVLKPVRGRLKKGDLQLCVDILERGGVIIFPTDTVYGMACSAFKLEGINRIYELKGRDYAKPLPVFLADAEQLGLIANDVPKEATRLIEEFWPGPLTLVLKTAPQALHVVRGKSTVAVRIPDHGLVRQILLAVHVPLAVTSANKSGQPSLKTGHEVAKQFEGLIEAIVDGGSCRIGRESTVVEASQFPFSILRQGSLSKEKLAHALNL